MNRTLEELKPTWNILVTGVQRFVDAMDGTAVLDLETGLVWPKVLTSDKFTWWGAMEYCVRLTLGGRKGWRLPAIEELASLVDPVNRSPALPSGHPFSNINLQEGYYWSSTSYVVDNKSALSVHMPSGESGYPYAKGDNNFNVFPVRGGK